MECQIGDKVRQLREYYDIHQEELARGICTQSTISRIEKDEIIPNAYILFRISQRLGVDVNYFFGTSKAPKLDYVQEVCDQFGTYVREGNYEEVLKIVKLEKRNPMFEREELKPILLWREGLCEFFLLKNKQKAFSLLEEALRLTPTTSKNNSSIEIDILSSIATFHGVSGEFEKVEKIYRNIFSMFKKIPKVDHQIITRVHYNMAVNAHNLTNFQEAISYCDQTIRICIKNFSMYLLGEVYFQKGESLYALNQDKDMAILWMKKSLSIFEQSGNRGAIDYVGKEIQKLKSVN